eukprot:gene11904-13870_t
MISGCGAGAMASLVTTPLDVVKTTLQVDQGETRRSVFKTFKNIVEKQGVRALYVGLKPTLLGLVPTWSIYFSTYTYLKATLSEGLGIGIDDSSAVHMLSAMGAGLIHVGVQLPLYEKFKKELQKQKKTTLSLFDIIVASSASKIIASVVAYPHEVLRSRLQDSAPDAPHSYKGGLIQNFRQIVQEEGVRGLYKGMGVNLLRVTPACAITFTSYEYIKQTIEFNDDGTFFLSIGSGSNIDPDSSRARVVKCTLDMDNIPQVGYHWTECSVWADGTRNEVGIRLDQSGQLWGVENGIDELSRPDILPKMSTDNPCEEINLFSKPGFYGYPYCFSRNNEEMSQLGVHVDNDTWCATNNVIKPVMCMTAHSAPLDLIFFNSTTFPEPIRRGILVAQHGSWDRSPASGYQVVHISQDVDGLPIAGSSRKIFGSSAPLSSDQKWNFRPVSLGVLSPCGPYKECLLVSSDSAKSIVAIRYDPQAPLSKIIPPEKSDSDKRQKCKFANSIPFNSYITKY